MQGKLRIAIAGTGFGEQYLIGLKALPEVEVVGVYSRRPERAAALAERYGVPYSTRHLHVLLGLPGLDAVAVVTPNSTHAEFVEAALEAGKHVICDKPLALNSEEGARLVTLAEARRLRHVTFVPYRFSPASVAIKEAIAEGQIGRILRVKASWGIDLRDEPLRWRFQRRLSGPGVVADLGAHLLDLLSWWAGPIRRVLGRLRTLVPQRPAEVGGRLRPVDVPDECWALLEFGAAGVGSLSLSWNGKRDQRVEVEGERGTLIYESPSLLQWLAGKGAFTPSVTLVSAGEAGRAQALRLPGSERFRTQETALAHMLGEITGYLRGGPRPDTVASFREGWEVLRAIDAIVASDEREQWAAVAQETGAATEGS